MGNRNRVQLGKGEHEGKREREHVGQREHEGEEEHVGREAGSGAGQAAGSRCSLAFPRELWGAPEGCETRESRAPVPPTESSGWTGDCARSASARSAPPGARPRRRPQVLLQPTQGPYLAICR